VDIDWRKYDWQDYMHKIYQWHPVQAMCTDYERPDQRRQLYQQMRDLKAAGVLRIMACPKFHGAVAHFPSWVLVAISVPSELAGFLPEFEELRGRNVHLLGGSARRQVDLIPKLQGYGVHVQSVDGNGHTRAAAWGRVWDGGRVIALSAWDHDLYENQRYATSQIRKSVDYSYGVIQHHFSNM
jgi:hypothetical protein